MTEAESFASCADAPGDVKEPGLVGKAGKGFTGPGVVAARRSPPIFGSPRAAPDLDLAARMENTEKENKELKEELTRARKQNEKSMRKIEELQQTLNDLFKRMGEPSGGIPTPALPPPAGLPSEAMRTATGGEGQRGHVLRRRR
ncbi:hypothetical protein HPB52_019961 [Rhipicephalus sanguineus]|uniref:Uncharacterized protein n=1 Tax=Rhipicephalus sanguineus TaxID=34632 RepID=A0A9D4Q850_RHISA|nr:hypothetical protein HPB52_019961 [Rhipicephalus sanguineus]